MLLAAFSPGGLRRVGRRLGGWLPVAMPVPHLMGMWDVIQKEAVQAEHDPAALRMALRVNPELTDTNTDPDRMPQAGTLGQYIDYARAAEAGVHELFVDFGQIAATLAERVDLAGRPFPRMGPPGLKVPRVPRCSNSGSSGMCELRRWFPGARTSMGEALKRPDSDSQPSRLRRLRLPGTVPVPAPAASRRPQDEDDKQQASGADTDRQVAE